ncbi:hypothetical protein Hanom_Chr02g00105761 [Helianthus anomalus]
MSKELDMLGGYLKSIQIPPKPFMYSTIRSRDSHKYLYCFINEPSGTCLQFVESFMYLQSTNADKILSKGVRIYGLKFYPDLVIYTDQGFFVRTLLFAPMVVYILCGCMQSVVMKTNAFWRNLSVQDCILERETNRNFVCSSLCVIVICEFSVHSHIVRFSYLLYLLYEFYDAVRDTRWFPHTVCVSSDPGSCVRGASHCRKTIL